MKKFAIAIATVILTFSTLIAQGDRIIPGLSPFSGSSVSRLESEPDCSNPRNVTLLFFSQTSAYLTWDGPSAAPERVKYIVRYKPVKGATPWIEVEISEGKEAFIDRLIHNYKYEFEVKKVCFWIDGSPLYSDWVKAVGSYQSKVTLPSFNCGDPYQYEPINCDSTNLLTEGDIDVFYLGGFPVEVLNITLDTTFHVDVGTYELNWTGTGLVPLPFGFDKYATIEFNNIVINQDTQVCSTRGITVLRDEEPNLPDLTPTLGFGNSEICIPPPSTEGFDSITGLHSATGLPWDPYGFGPTGKYVKQPPYPGYSSGFPYDSTQTYDPNGFNSTGIHALTGTQFNPQGCNRDGVDSLGQPCNPNIPPYSWMDPTNYNPATQAGMEYVEQIQDSLTIWIIRTLNQINAHNDIQLQAKAFQCDSIRNDMIIKLSLANVSDPDFVLGQNNEFINPGMHLHFESEPQPMALASWMPGDINQNLKDVEYLHIDLYHCDISQYSFIYIGEIIDEFLGADLAQLRQTIEAKIATLTEDEINVFASHPNEFFTWLSNQIKEQIQYEFILQHGEDGYTEISNRHDRDELNLKYSSDSFAPPSHRFSTSSLIASSDISYELLKQSEKITYDDLNFEYQQGFRLINGGNRAFYLESIAAERLQGSGAGSTSVNPYLQPIELLSFGEDGKGYRIYLDNIAFNANGPATMDAFIVVDLPFNGQRVVFEAHAVEFTPKGFVLNTGIKLQLVGDVPIRINNNAKLTLKGGADTYVAMDCSGYAGMGIQADVELCRNIVKPIDPVSEKILPEPERVNGTFTTVLPDFSSLYINFIVDPFVVTDLEDVKWKIDTISLDLSEDISPSGTPPPGYQTMLAGPSGFLPLWKGFYARSIEVSLPRKFRKDNAPLMVGVDDLMIDPMGVSCSVFASNILPLSQGSADGWGMSVDQFELTVLMSQVSKAEFFGKIHVPLFKDSTSTADTLRPQDCFNYTSMIMPGGRYQFTASQQAGVVYTADMWKASVNLTSTLVNITYANDSFYVLARLEHV